MHKTHFQKKSWNFLHLNSICWQLLEFFSIMHKLNLPWTNILSTWCTKLILLWTNRVLSNLRNKWVKKRDKLSRYFQTWKRLVPMQLHSNKIYQNFTHFNNCYVLAGLYLCLFQIHYVNWIFYFIVTQIHKTHRIF